MQIERIDHLVLTVQDVARTCEFYERVLGMQAITFGEGVEGRKALQFGSQKINLHQVGREFEPKALRPVAGSADLCFITLTPLEQVIEHFQACNVPVIEGPVRRTGATGTLLSAYIRDPDGNLIEVANYVE